MTGLKSYAHSWGMVAVLALACVSAVEGARAGAGDLIEAAERGDAAEVRALLGAGAEVNAARGDGATALLLASQNGHPEVVVALLRARADVNARDGYGDTALMAAALVPLPTPLYCMVTSS